MHEMTGYYKTANGSKYLQQLCKHFAHKISVKYSETKGECDFEMGKAYLSADEDGLTVRFELRDQEHVAMARGAIDSHLKKFAFREAFEHMDW